jgi:hypothetical protein
VRADEFAELKGSARNVWMRAQHEAAKCRGKFGFDNRVDASRAIRPRLRGTIEVYRCAFCCKYHVGGNTVKRQLRKAAKRLKR